jgi:hypothetical protein
MATAVAMALVELAAAGLALGLGLFRLAAAEESLEPAEETLRSRLRCLRVGSCGKRLSALVPGIARLALIPRVTRLALISRVSRLAPERVTADITTLRPWIAALGPGAGGAGFRPAVGAEGGAIVAAGAV